MAAPRVRLHPGAERDLEEGVRFYLERSHIVAGRFLDEIEAALELIQEAPERWPSHVHGTRRYVMAAFPYSLVYKVDSGEIHVYAVAHGRRRPSYWRERRR